MKTRAIVFLFVLVAAVFGKSVVFDTKSDFERGKLFNVAVIADGRLTAAPAVKKLFESEESTIWTAVGDSRGRIYLSTGNEGRILCREPDGQVRTLFDAEEIFFFALAVDRQDRLYAGASPGGKIYQITPDGQSRLFFSASAEYIWDLQFDARGRLLIATGKPGRIVRIDERNRTETLFQGEVDHVRTLAVRNDTLFFGTGGRGYVFRLAADGKPFVLYDPKMEEVHRLLLEDQSLLFAAALNRVTSAGAVGQKDTTAEADEDEDALRLMGKSGSISSSFFRISPYGYGKDLWVGSSDRIQTAAHFKDKLLIGCASPAKLILLDRNGESSLLSRLTEQQVSSFLQTRGRFFFTTAHPARLYELTESLADSLWYESEVIDANTSSQWSKLMIEGSGVQGITIFTRTGNTEQATAYWSSWQPATRSGDLYLVSSPAARFFQWKAVWNDRKAVIDKVTVNYAQSNQAPEVTMVVVHPPDEVYEAEGGEKGDGIIFPAPLGQKQNKRGFRCADWTFEDANFDKLVFSLSYRRVGEQLWRKMAGNLSVNVYSWDSMQMADGWYELKITANDSLSNPKEKSLKGERVSRPFLVDNSAPSLENYRVTAGPKPSVEFEVKDAWLPIKSAQISIDAGKWEPLYPVDGLFDAPYESFRFQLPDERPHDVAIKVEDQNGNVGVYHRP
ncbi:MAG: hypothetical protein ONB24_09965 [candidate division KSB1 bacterium]|nr:hypothetical protein [candidate division KSB1 bacterium]